MHGEEGSHVHVFSWETLMNYGKDTGGSLEAFATTSVAQTWMVATWRYEALGLGTTGLNTCGVEWERKARVPDPGLAVFPASARLALSIPEINGLAVWGTGWGHGWGSQFPV